MTSDSQDSVGFAAQAGVKQLFLRYGLGFLINIAGTIVIARIGGPELWGLFAISQVVLMIFAILSHGCWGYLIQTKTEPTCEVIGNCYTFQTVQSFALAGAVLTIASIMPSRLISRELTLLLWGTVVSGAFYGWRYVACGLSERNLRYTISIASELSDIITFNGIAIVFCYFDKPYAGIFLGTVFRGIISLAAAYIGARRGIYFHFDKIHFKKIVRFCIPYTTFVLLQWLPVYGGPIVAGSFLGMRELGILQLSYKTVDYPRVLVTMAFRLSMSIFSRMGESIDEIQKAALTAVDMLFAFVVPAMGVLIGLSPLWVPLVYGQEWMPMTNIMVIVVFPFLTMSMMLILSSLLSAQGKARAPFIFYIVYNCIYWPVVVIMTKQTGYWGLPVADWIGLFACSILLLELKIYGLKLNKIVMKLLALLIPALGIAGVWWLAAQREILWTALLGALMLSYWFVKSPGTKEIGKWIRG